MGPGSLTTGMWAQAAAADPRRPLPMFDQMQLALVEARPCPEYRRDYLKLAAWVFALLFGPALAALVVLLT